MYEIRKFLDRSDFYDLDEWIRQQDFDDLVNEVDGVTYPGIMPRVPEWLQVMIVEKLFRLTQRRLKINTTFFRLTTEDTPTAPHQAHTDSTMGKYTFLLYMQDSPEGVKAGTSLVKHKTVGGLHQDPWTSGEHAAWEQDHSNPDAWVIWKFFDMERNKAVFYDSKLMHRAEPVGGFGKGIEDGRLVLIAFLDPANG